ncbi:iron complex transport system permease protein [Saccharopolyspora antimicrobica]|uniref:Iron complex transport system permease protein n=1 Tax=Saccharopolyspora antimicrobica TaxID=455193 RepID=A0A1I4U1L7_9PSEU|nr:iron chelate uptake ABC transporter family permease subunit [Saccharopolyspora antimicrobica]RKT88639.1 iron complex transport system permease protein [Saccharopolyspora antimicrobica]SFM82884.1 iron complex transport system permease protein [Saccharopolyspora antimicrobica]
MTGRSTGDRSVADTRRPRAGTRCWQLLIAVPVLLALACGSLFVGVGSLTPQGLLAGHPDELLLLRESRLPRLIAILLAGAAMSVAGLIMIHVSRNRFVSPSTAGTTESASLGVLVATVLFGSASLLAKMAVAAVFALAGTFLFLALLRRITYRDMIVVPLLGIMLGGVISSVTTFFAYRADLLQTLSVWTSGDFSGVLRGRYELLWLAGAITLLGYLYANRFTVVGLGESFAINLGVDFDRVVNLGLVLVSVTTSVVVVTVGDIPFLGLIVPNLVTMALGDDLRRVLPVTALAGAFFVLLCDVLGRTIRFPYEIPVETVAGVIGSAVFIALVLKARKKVA